MSKTQLLPASFRAVLTVLLLALASFCTAPSALAQANANPPELMTYQGFLADGNGVALATNAPKNYDVIFRIYNDPTAGSLFWSEQQSVTVDKGYFSILLGEGTQVGAELHNPLSTVFTNTTASDRYMEMTVKGIGAAGADVKILPRLRLLSSPYAFLARSATKLVSSTGSDLVTSSGTNLTISGTLSASSITGVAMRSGGNTFTGNQIINASVGINKSPSSTLDVSGNFNVENSSGAFQYNGWPPGSGVTLLATLTGANNNGPQLRFTGALGGAYPDIGQNASGSFVIEQADQERITVTTGGNVGIGKTDPAVKLHVVGDVKLGASGELYAASSDANLRIVRGLCNSAGIAAQGSGYTASRTAAGTYVITFTTGFSNYPIATVSPYTSAAGWTATTDLPGYGAINVYLRLNGVLTDQNFNFIAIGPR